MPFLDGSYLALYRDPQKSYESIKKFSQHDADAFLEFHNKSQEAMDLFLAPATYVNPMPSLEQAAKLEVHPTTKWVDSLTGLTPKQIVDDIFENDRVRALFLYLATMWGLDYDLEGLGYLVPLMINRGYHYRLCKGGSHHLAHLFGKYISENGSRVMTGVVIERIIIEDGKAVGVELDDGTEIRARKFVCSSINPHQTFYELVGEDYLEDEMIIRLNEWKYSDTSFFTVHMALFEAPQFTIFEKNPELAKSLIYVVGYESEQDLVDHFEAAKRGELVDGGFNCCFPSIHDPSRVNRQANSAIKHIGLISMECAPYDLADGGPEEWNRVRRDYAERCKATLAKYAPNMKDNVAWDYIGTPLDTENKFPDMRQGCFKQGAYLPLQMGYFRPNEFCSRHFTPIDGLYMCGSCTFSGGMITFGPAYCAVNTIADQIGVEKFWKEPELITKAKEIGLF